MAIRTESRTYFLSFEDRSTCRALATAMETAMEQLGIINRVDLKSRRQLPKSVKQQAFMMAEEWKTGFSKQSFHEVRKEKIRCLLLLFRNVLSPPSLILFVPPLNHPCLSFFSQVIVIGGGVAGLATAWTLRNALKLTGQYAQEQIVL